MCFRLILEYNVPKKTIEKKPRAAAANNDQPIGPDISPSSDRENIRKNTSNMIIDPTTNGRPDSFAHENDL